jgi:hypothetical protein
MIGNIGTLKIIKMKKFAYVLVLAVALGIILSSCNRKASCPAYRGQVEHEQVAAPKA